MAILNLSLFCKMRFVWLRNINGHFATTLFPCILLLATLTPAAAQKIRSKKMVQKILKAHPEQFQQILANPQKYRVQILYTQINRDAQNKPSFKSYGYRVNPQEYFYPASTIKLPTALVALEKLNELNIPG